MSKDFYISFSYLVVSFSTSILKMDWAKIKEDIKDLEKRKEFFIHYLVDLERKLFEINQLLPTISEEENKESLLQAKERTEIEIRILRGSIEYLGNQIEIDNLRDKNISLMEKRKPGEYIEHLVKKNLYEIEKLTEKNKRIRNEGMELIKKGES